MPTLTTLHGRQDSPDLKALYAHFHDMPLVAISESQHRAIPKAHVAATVYHGLPANLLRPTLFARGGYLAFLGRISPEKGVDRAIEIARALGLPLKIAAKVDKVDEAYFERKFGRCSLHPASNSLEKSTSVARRSSSVTRLPCCSRSTGRNLSAWS